MGYKTIDTNSLAFLLEKALKYDALVTEGVKKWPLYYDAMANGLSAFGIESDINQEIDWEDYSKAVELEMEKWQ